MISQKFGQKWIHLSRSKIGLSVLYMCRCRDAGFHAWLYLIMFLRSCPPAGGGPSALGAGLNSFGGGVDINVDVSTLAFRL